MSSITEQAYQQCQHTARQHYENFPVASRLLPKAIRQPVSAIYAFARMADDFADEGNWTPQQRRDLLEQSRQDLLAAAHGKRSDNTVYIALADALEKQSALLPQLLDLLKAFNMDVDKNRYADFGELMQYCRYSANPIGRMLLILYCQTDTRNLAYADAICSALQIINFLQDIRSDYVDRDRVYMPADELARFDLSEQHLDGNSPAGMLTDFMDFQIQRALRLLQAGAPLGICLKGRIGLELRMVILGGWKVLEKLHQQRGNIAIQNRLNKRDWLWIISRALTSRFTVYLKKLQSKNGP